MGMFDFVKDIGKKIFGGDDDPAVKIKAELEAENPGVENLGVTYMDGVVTLSGKAGSAGAKEKAVLMAGNIQGVERVVADDLVAPEQKTKIEFYVVEKGDSLSKIAKRYYNDAMSYPRIFEANREVIKDPDLIYPGQKIRIPLD
jgi:nucleoid-associated protein YgaU